MADNTINADTEFTGAVIAGSLVPFTTGHTQWATGTDEIHRVELQAGETFQPARIEVEKKGGGVDSNLTVDFYDNDTSTVLSSADAGSPSEGGTESSDGATILVRLTNNTGGSTIATITANGAIV